MRLYMAKRILELLTRLDDFTAWSGTSIPFPGTGYSVRQPRLYDIAAMGEENFFQALGVFLTGKDNFKDPDKIRDEDIFLFICGLMAEDKGSLGLENKCIEFLLLLFPQFKVGTLYEYNIVLVEDIKNLNENFLIINTKNFFEFQNILRKIFMSSTQEEKYNPGNKEARRIAEKLKRGNMIAARDKGEEEASSILIRHCSVLSVGLRLDINTILGYTYLQFRDMLTRFHLNESFNAGLIFKAAGSTIELEDWEKEIT